MGYSFVVGGSSGNENFWLPSKYLDRTKDLILKRVHEAVVVNFF